MNTTGKEIEGRTDHTAAMSSDKRIIVYGGINRDKLGPALPYLAVLFLRSKKLHFDVIF